MRCCPDSPPSPSLPGQAVEQGLQLGELLDQLIEYWRDLMVVNCSGLEKQTLSVTGKQRALLKQQADKLTTDTILAGLDVLVSAKNRMRFTSHGRVVFEMALVRLARIEDLVPLSQLVQWAARESPAPAGSRNTRSQPTPQLASPSLSEKKKLTDDVSSPNLTILSQENLTVIWEQVLSQVGFILASELRKIPDVAIFGPNTLVLRIPRGYNSPDNQYLDGNRLAKVEEALTKITGQPCSHAGRKSLAPETVTQSRLEEARIRWCQAR